LTLGRAVLDGDILALDIASLLLAEELAVLATRAFLTGPAAVATDRPKSHSECKANPLAWLSVEFRCFFRTSIESSGEIAGF
jgi:hypothetical protein